MNVLHLLLRWILDLGVTATVAVTAAYGVFKLLGKKWIDTRFAQRLETFKHEQNQEIEHLRFRINALMDRTTKLHQYEFEVLPEVWNKLGIAFAQVRSFASRLTSYPDLDQMGPPQYAEFLATSGLPEWQKEELRGRDRGHRNGRYQEIFFWHRLHKVSELHADFHNFFISKGIFIQPELKEKIRSLSDMMYDAFNERRVDAEAPVLGEVRFAKGDRLYRDGLGALQAIEHEVQARLWEANTLE